MSAITPPKSLDELPGKLFEAWKTLGCELTEEDRGQFEQRWSQHETFGTYAAHQLALTSVPVRSYLDWRQPLINLVNSAPAEEIQLRGRQLVVVLGHFLDAASMFQLGALHDALLAHFDRNARDLQELQELAAVVPDLPGPELQRHALMRTAIKYGKPIIDAASRDTALIGIIPKLHPDTLNFPYDPEDDYSYFGSDRAHAFCQLLESPLLFELLLKHADERTRCEVFDRCGLVSAHLYEDGPQDQKPQFEFWSQLLPNITKYADEFAEVDPWRNDDIVNALWESDSTTGKGLAIAGAIEMLVEHDDASCSSRLESLQTMLLENSTVIGEAVSDRLRNLELDNLLMLWSIEVDGLRFAIIEAVAYKMKSQAEYEGGYVYTWDDDEEAKLAQRTKLRELICAALLDQGPQLGRIKPGDLSALMPFVLDDEIATAVLPSVQPLAAKSKPLRQALGLALANISPTLFADWAGDRRKGVRDVALEGLLNNASPQASQLLSQIRDDKRTSDADQDRIAAKLGAAAGDTSSEAPTSPTSIAEITSKAIKAKIKPQAKKWWSQELADLFSPYDEQTGQWLLSMTFESKDALPQTVEAALQNLSREQRAKLAEHLVALWLNNNGDSKLRWLLKLVPKFADDRVVDPLMKGFQGWYKRAKPKSVFVLETLGQLNTKYALSQVQEIYGKNIYSYALQKGAGDTLRAAAKRRSVDLLDLFDELTPDFGLGPDGLVLDVGPHNYVVSIAGDLSLRVTNSDTGKVTKSFPKIKKGEDAQLHANADSQFKFLRSSLKKVAKQQAKRLHEAMICERCWPLARWQVLFQQHPLLGLLGQSMIWATATGRSFRISEDQSLISADDEAIELSNDDQIRIWHPASVEATEVGVWTRHLTDYEVTPLLDQVGQPRVDFSDAELQAETLEQFAEVKIEQYIVKRYMESWNYDVDDADGSSIFGYYRDFPLAKFSVVLDLDDMRSFTFEGDTATLKSFKFLRDNKPVALHDVPKPLLATVIAQGNALKAQASS